MTRFARPNAAWAPFKLPAHFHHTVCCRTAFGAMLTRAALVDYARPLLKNLTPGPFKKGGPLPATPCLISPPAPASRRAHNHHCPRPLVCAHLAASLQRTPLQRGGCRPPAALTLRPCNARCLRPPAALTAAFATRGCRPPLCLTAFMAPSGVRTSIRTCQRAPRRLATTLLYGCACAHARPLTKRLE